MRWVLVLLLLTACAHIPIVGPAFDARDRWVYGTMTRIERDEDYEQPCRIWCFIHGGRSGDLEHPFAYDAQLADSTGKTTWIMFFAPKGNVIPVVGQVGWWHLWPETVENFASCNSYGCSKTFVWQLHSDEDLSR